MQGTVQIALRNRDICLSLNRGNRNSFSSVNTVEILETSFISASASHFQC